MIKSSDWKPPKCYHDEEKDVVAWILNPLSSNDREKFTKHTERTNENHGKPTEKALDTSIMELADDIAYGVHDLEDGIALQLITREMWTAVENKLEKMWMTENEIPEIGEKLFGNSSQRKRAIGALVHAFMTNAEVIEKSEYESPLLSNNVGLSGNSKSALKLLTSLVVDNVIKIPEVQTLEFRGQQIVIQLFNAIASDPERFLKKTFQETWKNGGSETEKLRVVCDFISGMTDEYATRMYERFFLPRHGTIFQRL